MFHTPAHKQVPKTLGDAIKNTEQQMGKEDLTTGQLLKTCFNRAVEQTSDLGNKWDHWELAASMFLAELHNR